MKFIPNLLSLFAALALFSTGSWALTGGKTVEQQQEPSEEEVMKLMDVANGLRDIVPQVSAEDSLGLASLLQNLRDDDETKILLEALKSDEVTQDPELKEFLKNAPQKDIIVGMNHIFDELKALEMLFQNPTLAVEELSNEGIIVDDARLNAYRENPQLLQDDMRSGFYVSFVSLAAAGGYL
mmetsp:Transcript_19943/g.46823  ORF Transcript_19943/g.46823 Transcript_19943/m.46823 type:complete len:182 (-) Transcript_19943:112-657(-)